MKSQATRVRKGQVEEQSCQFQPASRARSRFFSANHDLRQPLHALGLFTGQLRSCSSGAEHERIVEQIDAAVSALNWRINELFEVSRGNTGMSTSNGEDEAEPTSTPARAPTDLLRGRCVVVIDDDPLVLDGTCGLLRSWCCNVVAGDSAATAFVSLLEQRRTPDLIISDFRLSEGRTGIEAIAQIRNAFPDSIPAFLVSGDVSPDATREVRSGDYHLLHKPVAPMALRAMVTRMLKKN
jgi:CheY-like chemotaxis protein